MVSKTSARATYAGGAGTTYLSPYSTAGNSTNATEAKYKTVAATGGSLSNLYVKVTAAPGAGTSLAFTLRVNGADSALTCTISNTATTANDTTHSVAISAGDVITISVVATGAVTGADVLLSMDFTGTTSKESCWFSDCRAANIPNTFTTYKGPFSSSPETIAVRRQLPMPTSGTIKNFYGILENAPGGATSRTFTVLKNGSATALTFTISGASTTGNDTTHSFTVAAGDTVAIQCDEASTPAASTGGFGLCFVADTDGQSVIAATNAGSMDNASTGYYAPVGGLNRSTTESDRYMMFNACTLKNFYVVTDAAPGAGNSFAFDVRVNSASPASTLAVTIADANTSGNDTTDTVTVATNDLVDIRCVPSGTPTTGNYRFGIMVYVAPATAANGNLLMFF